MRSTRLLFRIAGIYGLIVLLPFYFLAPSIARATPGGLAHLEYYYGFIGGAVAFQFLYLTIARDPVRFRPLIPIGMFSKLSFFVPVAILWSKGVLAAAVLGFASIDLLLAIAFGWAWMRTPPGGGQAA